METEFYLLIHLKEFFEETNDTAYMKFTFKEEKDIHLHNAHS